MEIQEDDEVLTIHVEDNFLGQSRHHMAVGGLAGVHLKGGTIMKPDDLRSLQ